jgi:hypothetical protein
MDGQWLLQFVGRNSVIYVPGRLRRFTEEALEKKVSWRDADRTWIQAHCRLVLQTCEHSFKSPRFVLTQ